MKKNKRQLDHPKIAANSTLAFQPFDSKSAQMVSFGQKEPRIAKSSIPLHAQETQYFRRLLCTTLWVLKVMRENSTLGLYQVVMASIQQQPANGIMKKLAYIHFTKVSWMRIFQVINKG